MSGAASNLSVPRIEGVARGWSPTSAASAMWGLDHLYGCLSEICAERASAALTLTFRFVLEAQRRKEPVAWIVDPGRTFYPPDAADCGIDLEALAVIRAPRLRAALSAADHLIRSGAFGLVVLDFGRAVGVSLPVQARLAGLAQKHRTALVCLTERVRGSSALGSLVSLRIEAVRVGQNGGRFACEARVLKDKRCGPGWTHEESCRGPDGLC